MKRTLLRKFGSALLLGLYLTALPVGAQASETKEGAVETEVILRIGQPLMFVNMLEVPLDTVPVVRGDRAWLPLRPLAESLGAEVTYQEGTPLVEVALEDQKVQLRTDSTVIMVNDRPRAMSVAPFVNSDARTMVPVRVVSEGLGFEVEAYYDENGVTRSVVVKKTP